MNQFRSMVLVLAVIICAFACVEAMPNVNLIQQEDCVVVGKPTKDDSTQVYAVPVSNGCTYKVKVLVTNGGVNYGKILEPAAAGQIVLGKSGAKDDYAVTWKKM